ncbi:hypothetical protein D3C81_1134170 [compost metagenome]
MADGNNQQGEQHLSGRDPAIQQSKNGHDPGSQHAVQQGMQQQEARAGPMTYFIFNPTTRLQWEVGKQMGYQQPDQQGQVA